MADPQHVPEMDAFDERSVRMYRAGLLLAALGLLALGLLAWFAPDRIDVGRDAVVLGAALAGSNLHLYDKRIRSLIVSAAWMGAVVMLLAPSVPGDAGRVVGLLGLGLVFVGLSGFALKEQFCFRVPLMRGVPWLLAMSLVPLLARWWGLAGGLLVVAGAAYLLLAVTKIRMPLHHDIGDKSKYQH